MKYKKSKLSNFADILIHGILLAAALSCLLPLLHVLALSFSSSAAATAGQVSLWPVGITLDAYRYVASKSEFWRAFGVSVQRIMLGVSINMLLTILAAYPMARTRNRFRSRNIYMWFFMGAALFSGGMIPTYITVAGTGIMGTIWALILPGALPIFNMIVLMNFFKGLPDEIEEAAFIDGAGHMTTLLRIYLPLSLPSLATLTLFSFVGHWNSWFDGLLYMNQAEKYPLQSYLQTIVLNRDLSTVKNLSELANLSDRTIKAAQIFLGSLPIILIYPLLQRYFMKGLVVGSVKG